MIESFWHCWQGWVLMLLAVPLLFRSGAYAAEIAMLQRRGRTSDIAAMLARGSQSSELESRLMTTAVALAAVLLSFGLTSLAELLLMAWMAFRWGRFTHHRRSASYALVAMVIVGGMAALGERL